MTDTLDELKRLAATTTPALPYVRVTGELLMRAADEIAGLRKLNDERTRAMLFETDKVQAS
jgi:hypothetical protein